MQEDSVWNFGPIEVEIHMEHSDIRRHFLYLGEDLVPVKCT